VYQPAGKPRISIVRFLSFLYDPNDTKLDADHALLARELRASDGVVVDVHGNGGGIEPFRFLSWFSRGPFDYPRLVSKVDPDLSPDDVRGLYSNAQFDAYTRAQHDRQPTSVTHFFCDTEPCTNVTPPDLRVTHAPVAVVTGPDCASSCDTFSLEWSAFHLG